MNQDHYEFKKGIVTWLQGGLGNQIFIIVAAWAASKYHTCPLYLFQNKTNKHNILKHNYLDSIFKFFGIHLEEEQSHNTYNKLYNKQYVDFHSRFEDAYVPYSLETVPIPSIFSGYYQYYPSLIPYKDEISTLLISGLSDYRNNVISNYPDVSFENAAFLHIRRGDYLKLTHHHPIISLTYYKTCIDRLDKKIKTICICSDDIEWAKEQTLFLEDPRCMFVESRNELYTLSLMSLCTGGAICANSSFSWWGAFLGAYSKENQVFIPKPWVYNLEVISLFPETWVTVNSDAQVQPVRNYE